MFEVVHVRQQKLLTTIWRHNLARTTNTPRNNCTCIPGTDQTMPNAQKMFRDWVVSCFVPLPSIIPELLADLGCLLWGFIVSLNRTWCQCFLLSSNIASSLNVSRTLNLLSQILRCFGHGPWSYGTSAAGLLCLAATVAGVKLALQGQSFPFYYCSMLGLFRGCIGII